MRADPGDAPGGKNMNEEESADPKLHALQPNSRDCFVCGMENGGGLKMRFHSVGPGQVEARYSVDPRYQGYPGVVHGGIIAAMLDEVVGRVMMTEDPNRFFMTAKLEIRYRAPVPIGEELLLKGRLDKQKGRMTFARGELYLPDGTLAVQAEAAMVEWTDAPVGAETRERLGWRVYQDTPAQDQPTTEVA